MCDCLAHFSQLPDRDDPQEFAFSPNLRAAASSAPPASKQAKQEPAREKNFLDYSEQYQGLEPLFKVMEENPRLRNEIFDALRKNGAL